MTILRSLAGGLVAALLLFGAAPSFAQGTIQQSGSATSGHTVQFIQNGIVQDAGPASGGGPGLGLSELLRTARGTGTPPYANAGSGPYSTNDCNYDAPVNNPGGYHYLCFSPNAQAGGLLVYGAGGGAPELPFQFLINGTPINPLPNPDLFRIVTTASAMITVADDNGTVAFKSTVTSARTATLPICNSGAKGFQTTITDDSTAGFTADIYPIFIVPVGSDTITYFPTFPMNGRSQSAHPQCDGAGNWIIK